MQNTNEDPYFKSFQLYIFQIIMLTFVVLILVFIIFNSYEKYKYINSSEAKYYAKQYYNAHLIQIIKRKYKKIKLYENK